MHIHRNGILGCAVLILGAFAATAAGAADNVTIGKKKTHNGTLANGVFTPTGPDAVLNVDDLIAALALSDVTVTTGTLDAQDGDITVAKKLLWTANTLILDAHHAINIGALVTASTAAGLALRTNDGGTGGDVVFTKGRIAFDNTVSTTLSINNIPYTLAANVTTLASGISGAPTGYFALADNYDASIDATYKTSPIPTLFGGTFIGLGNKISNLSIADTTHENVAMFFALNTGGVIRDFGLTNLTVSNSTPSYDGGMVVTNLGTLFNVSVSGHVSGTSGYAGGLVADNQGIVNNSRSTATVKNSSGGTVGGLVAINKNTIINSNAKATASDTTTGTVGGLVGWNYSGSITTSFATGTVSSAGPSGGLVGQNSAAISQSYATTKVAGGTTAGGLVGLNSGTIHDSYAKGDASGVAGATVGGLIGSNSSAAVVGTSYSTGAPSGGDGAIIGGFIGSDGTTNGITSAYWDTDTSGITNPAQGAGNIANDAGIMGLTDRQLKSGLPAGFSGAIWGQRKGMNGGLPYLLAIP